MSKLTNMQREWLIRLTESDWKVCDICSGGTSQLMTRLQNKGLIAVKRNDDWRLSTYYVTEAGLAFVPSPQESEVQRD